MHNTNRKRVLDVLTPQNADTKKQKAENSPYNNQFANYASTPSYDNYNYGYMSSSQNPQYVTNLPQTNNDWTQNYQHQYQVQNQPAYHNNSGYYVNQQYDSNQIQNYYTNQQANIQGGYYQTQQPAHQQYQPAQQQYQPSNYGYAQPNQQYSTGYYNNTNPQPSAQVQVIQKPPQQQNFPPQSSSQPPLPPHIAAMVNARNASVNRDNAPKPSLLPSPVSQSPLQPIPAPSLNAPPSRVPQYQIIQPPVRVAPPIPARAPVPLQPMPAPVPIRQVPPNYVHPMQMQPIPQIAPMPVHNNMHWPPHRGGKQNRGPVPRGPPAHRGHPAPVRTPPAKISPPPIPAKGTQTPKPTNGAPSKATGPVSQKSQPPAKATTKATPAPVAVTKVKEAEKLEISKEENIPKVVQETVQELKEPKETQEEPLLFESPTLYSDSIALPPQSLDLNSPILIEDEQAEVEIQKSTDDSSELQNTQENSEKELTKKEEGDSKTSS